MPLIATASRCLFLNLFMALAAINLSNLAAWLACRLLWQCLLCRWCLPRCVRVILIIAHVWRCIIARNLLKLFLVLLNLDIKLIVPQVNLSF